MSPQGLTNERDREQMQATRMRRILVGGALVVAVGAASASALVFSGRDDSSSVSSGTVSSVKTHATSTTSTSTTSTTTTTTAPPPPPPPPTEAPAAAPAPQQAPAPAPAPPPPPPPPPSGGCDGSGGPVVSAMNGDRAANGLGALCGNGQLAGIAQNWANWMAQHNSLTHQDLNSLIGGLPYNTMGENILVGPGGMSVGQMESAWMNSAPHRANILSGAFSAAGVGMAYSADGQVWVAVDFGG